MKISKILDRLKCIDFIPSQEIPKLSPFQFHKALKKWIGICFLLKNKDLFLPKSNLHNFCSSQMISRITDKNG